MNLVKHKKISFCHDFQLVFEMEGFDIKVEGMFGGQVIPLLSVDGSIQGEVKNWSSAVSQSRENSARNLS